MFMHVCGGLQFLLNSHVQKYCNFDFCQVPSLKEARKKYRIILIYFSITGLSNLPLVSMDVKKGINSRNREGCGGRVSGHGFLPCLTYNNFG